MGTETSAPRIHGEAVVDESAQLGPGTAVWAMATIRADASIGRECVIGQSAFVDTAVVVGDRCKIQNNALVYAPATLGDGVFIGPAAVLTNDRTPRAVMPDGALKREADWEMAGVVVHDGASIGANATVVAGIEVGAWALIAAGAVVTRSVPAHGLVAGVPAARIGWVGRSGRQLVEDGGMLLDPDTGDRYADHGDWIEGL